MCESPTKILFAFDIGAPRLPVIEAMKSVKMTSPPRIAVIWESDAMRSREAYHSLCRFNERGPRTSLQRFHFGPSPTRPFWIQVIKDWRPDGVLVQTGRWSQLKKLRKALPDIPILSAAVAPPGLADSCVVADVSEIMEQARDHFLSRGVRNLGLYCCADNEAAIRSRSLAFRAAAPDGFELLYDGGDQPGGRGPIYTWLKSLPKPVGIIAAEMIGGPFLLGCCNDIGIKVPEEVQIIGVDDADECLAQNPHLASFELPSQRIGITALKTLLGLIEGRKPAPPSIVQVSGSKLVVRSSTAMVQTGRSAAGAVSKYIRQYASRDISVGDMARLAGMGRTTFCKEFRKATGKSPASYRRDMRLQDACRMLRETPAKVTDIAKACGYKSLIYFVQFFRQKLGETPSDYRRRHAAVGKTP